MFRSSEVVAEAAGGEPRIYGKLGSVSLNDILQLLGMTQRTATVRLESRGRNGQIFFRDGVLLHAATRSATGEQALVKLVSWEGAEFVIEEGVEGDPPTTIGKNVDAAMLDVLTRLDEGWIPEATPYPLLDRPLVEALDRKVRLASRPGLKPPLPRRRSRTPQIAAAALLVGALALGTFLVRALTGVEPPPVARAGAARAALVPAEGVAGSTLLASIERRDEPAERFLAAHGLDVGRAAVARDPSPAAGPPPPAPEPPPPAPIAAPTGFGHLLVVVEPWAEVTLDGVPMGETPLDAMRVAAGVHELSLSNPNHIGRIRDRIEVPAGETIRRSYSFERAGSLRLLVRPWADVFVDGRHVGQTPMGGLRLPLGTHRIVLRHPELGEKSVSVEVREGRESVVEVEM